MQRHSAAKMKIELKQAVYPYCKEEDQSTLQTAVTTCKRKRIPLESAGLRELPFLPNDCLAAWEVYARTKGKVRLQLQPRMEFPARGLGEHPNPDHAELKVS